MAKMKIFHLICLVLFLSLQHSIFFSTNSIFSYLDLKKTYHSYEKNVSQLVKQNNHLKVEISKASNSQKYLEAYARENYGYIKKNEIFFQIIKDEK
tara:strand:+ start:39 stop:326 length:288 start_codon:yes stop_codon:yes gene_type:complete